MPSGKERRKVFLAEGVALSKAFGLGLLWTAGFNRLSCEEVWRFCSFLLFFLFSKSCFMILFLALARVINVTRENTPFATISKLPIVDMAQSAFCKSL